MPGPVQPWDKREDPRESTVDLPRVDLAGLADYFRGAAPPPADASAADDDLTDGASQPEEPARSVTETRGASTAASLLQRLEALDLGRGPASPQPSPASPQPGPADSGPAVPAPAGDPGAATVASRAAGPRPPAGPADAEAAGAESAGDRDRLAGERIGHAADRGSSSAAPAADPAPAASAASSAAPAFGAPAAPPVVSPAPHCRGPAPQTVTSPVAPTAASPVAVGAAVTAAAKPAATPPAAAGRVAQRPVSPRPAERPSRGSLADLRSRLSRLPDGHPSSPFDDAGRTRPLPTRLKQLELGLPAPEREADLRAAEQPSAPGSGRPRSPANARDSLRDASDLRSPSAAHPESTGGNGHNGDRSRHVQWGDPYADAPRDRDGSDDTSAADRLLGPADRRSDGNGSSGGNGSTRPPGRPDSAELALGPWTGDRERDGSGRNGSHAPESNGHSRLEPGRLEPGRLEPRWADFTARSARGDTDRRPYPEPQLPDLKPLPADRSGSGSWQDRDRHGVTPDTGADSTDPGAAGTGDLRQLVERTLSTCRAAEGQNMFGGYTSSGLTPTIQRIAAQLPAGGLAADSDADTLKPSDRLGAKLSRLIARYPSRAPEDLAAAIGDVIRYAFAFEPADYVEGTLFVHRKLTAQGFELEVRRNRWESPEHKGVFTRWRDPAHGVRFEVQFHTAASWAVAKRTHEAYVQITDPATRPADRARLRARQVAAATSAQAPPGWRDIADFRLDAT